MGEINLKFIFKGKVTLAGSVWVHWVPMLVLKISVCLISPCIYFFLSWRSCRAPLFRWCSVMINTERKCVWGLQNNCGQLTNKGCLSSRSSKCCQNIGIFKSRLRQLMCFVSNRGHPHRQGRSGFQGHWCRHFGGFNAQEGGHGEEGPAQGQRGHLQDARICSGQVCEEDCQGDPSTFTLSIFTFISFAFFLVGVILLY